jgi:hypothetical protein
MGGATTIPIGTRDFTIELWAYQTSVTTQPSLIEAPQNGVSINLAPGTSRLQIGQSFVTALITDTVSFPTNQWVSIAACRQGTTLYLFKNGTLINSVTNSTNFTQTVFPNFYIGSSATNGGYNGYIDEVRISNICRYTANYTPATEPFTNDANTLLLCHFNNTVADDVT